MIDKDKIIVLTKLAIYDKYDGYEDKKANDYFIHDYIYRKNFWNRLCSGIGAILVILLRFLHKIVIEQVDLVTIDYKKEAMDALVIFLAILLIYTIIGTIKSTIEYTLSQRRLKRYFKLMTVLEKLDKQAYKKLNREIEETSYNGTDVTNERTYN